MDLLAGALALHQARLCVLPAITAEKRAALPTWKPYQTTRPTEQQLRTWITGETEGLCVVTGKVSGNLELIDFDGQGALFDAWLARVSEASPALLERLVIETSPSGGWHVIYRCEEPVHGNLKLAQRCIPADSAQPVEILGKHYTPRKDVHGNWSVLLTLIETRGEGGLFLCAPTPGYEPVQGDLAQVQTLSVAERQILLEAAWSLNEHFPEPVGKPSSSAEDGFKRPGDDYNERGDIPALLLKHGWSLVRPGENAYWRRPGKTQGWSATLKSGVLYVFSSNAAPFEADRAYAPFAVYALLEHHGDYTAAARSLRQSGFGDDSSHSPHPTPLVDLTGLNFPSGAPCGPRSLSELIATHPQLHPPVIHGLLREGETMNIISAPKRGKSWLVLDLALAIATGSNWLGMSCVPGNVLIIDNELHAATSANRIPKVAAARGFDLGQIGERLYVDNLRGRLQDLFALRHYFKQFQPGQFKVIILDAFYRFLPLNSDENDNGTMANLYNYLDAFAHELKCSFVLIHHTSKGNQSAKSVTDVGAGAGAQSRATDTHLVLRPHEEEDAVVLDAAVRSWPPVPPRCLRWAFPVWRPADDLDPADLRREKPKRRTREPNDKDREDAPEKVVWSAEAFVEALIGPQPKLKGRVLAEANEQGLSDYMAEKLLRKAEALGLIHRHVLDRQRTGYATEPQPELDLAKPTHIESPSDPPRAHP